jgi:hypothetical protein
LFLAVFGLGRGITPPFAFAQDAKSTVKIDRQENSRREEGRILIVAFRNGVPASGVAIEGSFGTFTTRGDGTVSKSLPAGKYKAHVPALNQSIEFSVQPDLETQVSLQLLEKKRGDVALSEPVAEGTATASAQPKVELELKIVSEKDGKPVEGASILAAGSEDVVQSGADGRAKIKVHGPNDGFSVFHSKFQTKTSTSAALKNGTISMKEAVNELEEVVVLAPKMKGSLSALVEIRRQSSAVTDVLGAEQMSRAGDSDAAAALRRVTGLTMIDGKYVYVRGLGERYSGVQMNGFSVPSPEPARRVVPLDLFPTAILESVVVQKSYSPDLPGEFGGGLIQLQTKTLPEKFFFKGGVSTNIENSENRLSSAGGSTDWLGIDDGSRKLPGPIRDALSSGKKLFKKETGSDQGVSEEELVALGKTLPTNYNTSRTNKQAMPNITVSSGDRFKLGATQLGMAGSLLYGQSVDSGEKVNRGFKVGSGTNLEKDYDAKSEYAEVETRVAGSADFGWALSKNHRVDFNTFLLRHTTDYAKQESKVSQDTPNTTMESTTLEWTERQLWTKNLKGKHNLLALFDRPVEVAWRAGRSDAKRDSPDRRDYAYNRQAGYYSLRDGSGGNRRTYSYLTDKSEEVGLDITVPLSRTPDKLKLKIGLNESRRERTADVFRLYFLQNWAQGGPAPVDMSSSPDELFKESNRRPGIFILQSLTDSGDSYAGRQSIHAQYAMLDYSPVKSWSFQAGARAERSRQSVKTYYYYDPNKPTAEARIDMNDVLPAYSAVWKPNDKWRSRLAYSETVARPDFRELSDVRFFDDEIGYIVTGNPELTGTVIKNFDHRWEYYFTSDEYLSLGGFYKKFKNPVEVVFEPAVNKTQTFENARSANNYGVEFEGRVGLRHATRFLRRWSVLYNYTWIQSKVEVAEGGSHTSKSRPLQGQAPYSQNFQLQYDYPLWGFSATALYNVVGPRITEVGTNAVPDTYEQPAHELDFVASKIIAKSWNVGLKAKNLLNPVVESRQGGEVVRSYRRGITTGVSINAVF